MNNLITQIIGTIDRAENILLMPSSPVDADSLGSSLALHIALKKLGKISTVICSDPIPEVYSFLPMIETIKQKLALAPDFIISVDLNDRAINSVEAKVEDNKLNIFISPSKGNFSANNISYSYGQSKYDLIITVDTASTIQLGKFYEDNIALFSQIPVINIDHHASNEGFGRINYVDIMSSSTTEMILILLEHLEKKIDQKIIDEDIATLLLSGIITDTGSFQNSNTNPRSFAAAANLIRHGARQQEIIQHIYKTKQLTMLRLWGRILTNIVNDETHHFVWSTITRKDLMETGGKEDDTAGIIDELMSNAPGTEVVLLLKEKEGKVLSGSIRSTLDSLDVSQIAEQFGGGGHTRAAGFKIKNADIQSHGKIIVDFIKSFQAKRLNLNQDQQFPQETQSLPHISTSKPFTPSLQNKIQSEAQTSSVSNETQTTTQPPNDLTTESLSQNQNPENKSNPISTSKSSNPNSGQENPIKQPLESNPEESNITKSPFVRANAAKPTPRQKLATGIKYKFEN